MRDLAELLRLWNVEHAPEVPNWSAGFVTKDSWRVGSPGHSRPYPTASVRTGLSAGLAKGTEGEADLFRRVSVLAVAALLAATILPATVAAAGQGKALHGGSPTAPVTVQCGFFFDGSDWRFDVAAFINPALVDQMLTNGYPFGFAWQKSSAKASAPAFFLGDMDTSDLGTSNIISGEFFNVLDPAAIPAFTYVQVDVGYFDVAQNVDLILASGTIKCSKGPLFNH